MNKLKVQDKKSVELKEFCPNNMKAQVSVSMLENGYFRRHIKIANNILVNSVKYLY